MRRRYADAERIAFKSATRLECMMQDYPKELPATASVGFTVVNQARWCQHAGSVSQCRGCESLHIHLVSMRILFLHRFTGPCLQRNTKTPTAYIVATAILSQRLGPQQVWYGGQNFIARVTCPQAPVAAGPLVSVSAISKACVCWGTFPWRSVCVTKLESVHLRGCYKTLTLVSQQ